MTPVGKIHGRINLLYAKMKTAPKDEADRIMTKIYDLKKEINNFSSKGKEGGQPSTVGLPRDDGYRHEGFWWYIDVRPDPWAEGPAEWKMFPDHKSVAIDRRYHKWLEDGKK